MSTVWWPDGLLTESGHRLRYLHSFVLRSLKKIKPIPNSFLKCLALQTAFAGVVVG